jgi:hypothetical protein
VLVDDMVEGIFKVLEGRFEFLNVAKYVRDREFVEFGFQIFDEFVPCYFSPVVSWGWGGAGGGDV